MRKPNKIALAAALAISMSALAPANVYAEEQPGSSAPTAPHLGEGKLALGVPEAQSAGPSVSAGNGPQSASNSSAGTYTGAVLSASLGRIYGPSGVETYYNLDMSGVVANTRAAGIEGDYWVRDDGVKMYGEYVIAACDVTGAVHNRYDVVDSSLGAALCMDTGTFAAQDPHQLDIATTW